ncbi:Mitochondrial-processing peptidase subunit beta [Komagataella phaffii CBS 7435]|uniref:mitochondrial processing peptidase n=2 Tax=Komagataella phaffii TaxID=460519 RepID=C4R5S1_KOMPG|nr:Smaller subunit of the mitochondrial processing protease (MPP) [Komagataella phaffii GS115]AOA63307.1 GQ67_03967T0 [Komagataella phaffii]CAH2449282.1 Mitochondrial-processing peptidase subunit beta [Komagataella phaffii CBS 7435]AOA68582.1 GQ68_03940T0 [Komagataella phaffii GS115]CAY70907.1 Smaller subunit of the mitochondrial processing protease (MPP) [Komagataella phaffii GS115]CCA39295.1 Mitochondrial-processing peptidase subunit beta [Komagataella phaffii CBS 7435]
MLSSIARGVTRTGLKRLNSSFVPVTRTSTLPNGITVATESIPNVQTATVGVWIDAGSRADVSDSTSGTAHFLEHLAFKGTSNRSQLKLELEVEDCGSHLNAYTSRENTVYYAKAVKDDIPRAVDILSDILTRSKLEKLAIEKERPVILRESEEVDKMYDEVVFDRLHEVTFKGQPLGRTILGPLENIRSLTQGDLKNYIKTNYKGDRMVLVGAGAVDHEELVKLAQKSFGHVPLSEEPVPLGSPRGDLPIFYGGEARVEDRSLPNTYMAISIEGVSWNAIDYFTALVAQAIVGNWERSTGINSPSPLAVAVSTGNGQGQPLANSYMSFSTSYSDIGLWGMYLTADKDADLKPLVDEVLKEWTRLKNGHISDKEVETAKDQLKGSLLLSLDGSTPIAEDIGRQIVTTGTRLSPEEVFDKVNRITKDDVIQWARWRIHDKPIAVAALGHLDTLPSYKYMTKELAK